MRILILTILAISASAAPFATGDLFISSREAGTVSRFDQSGALLQTIPVGTVAWGLTFDPAGNLCVAAGTSVQKFDNQGNPLGSFGSGLPGIVTDIGFDPSGTAFMSGIIDASTSWIASFTSTGTLIESETFPAEEGAVYLYASRGAPQVYFAYPTGAVSLLNTIPFTLDFGFSGVTGASGDVRELPAGAGVLLGSSAGVRRLDSSGNLVQTYDFLGADVWRGVDLDLALSSFWAVDDFARVREFDLASGAILTEFSVAVGGRPAGLAVYAAPIPEPGGLLITGAGLLLVFAVRRRHVLPA